MLSVRTTKAMISDVSWIVSIDVNVCHENVVNYFPYNVGDEQCALDYLRNKIILFKEMF